MGHPSKPPRGQLRPGGHSGSCETAVLLTIQASGPSDERFPGSDERGHLPIQAIPDHAAQLRSPALGRLVHRRGRPVWLGELRPGPTSGDDQEW